MTLLLILLLFLSALPGIAAQQEQSAPNVLLVTIDTLRADHLSSYGYYLKTSPNIDQLAREGALLKQAHTVIPQTGPAHMSLFTGRFPQEHGSRINGLAYDHDAKLLFLPQVFRKFGYSTAAFISAWPLVSRLTDFDQMFDLYDEDLPRSFQMFNSMRWAEDVTPKVTNWLRTRQNDKPFFLWVHYFDPHSPYELRKEYANPEKIGEPGPAAPQMKSSEARERVRKYDSEIGYTDHWLGRVFAQLERLGIKDNTLIVVMADHGESLGEHDYVGHGRQLYNPIVHIPLIIRYPALVQAGKVINEKVSLIDVWPTIVDLTLKQADSNLVFPVKTAGRSFAKYLNGSAEPEDQMVRYVTFAGKKGFMPKFLSSLFGFTRGLPLRMGHTVGTRKVIWSPDDQKLEIFNLAADPLELKPSLPKPKSPQYGTETARLQNWFDSSAGAAGENKMTDEDVKALKSLGYLK